MKFTVKDKRAGHKVVTHAGLQGFTTTAYNCTGGNGIVKRAYLRKIRNVAREYEQAIRRLMDQ